DCGAAEVDPAGNPACAEGAALAPLGNEAAQVGLVEAQAPLQSQPRAPQGAGLERGVPLSELGPPVTHVKLAVAPARRVGEIHRQAPLVDLDADDAGAGQHHRAVTPPPGPP